MITENKQLKHRHNKDLLALETYKYKLWYCKKCNSHFKEYFKKQNDILPHHK